MLGVPISASQITIKTAFKQLAKKYHPDLNAGHEEHFKDVNQAYQLLSDPTAKAHYDRIHHYVDIQGTEAQAGRRGDSQKQKFEESSDPRDHILFEELRRQQE